MTSRNLHPTTTAELEPLWTAFIDAHNAEEATLVQEWFAHDADTEYYRDASGKLRQI